MAPDFDRAVDATDLGVGAVLLQADSSGVDRPSGYFSRKLNRHQKIYSTIEKEALALVLAVQHFEVHLAICPGDTIVYTDHNPLVFLEKFKANLARVRNCLGGVCFCSLVHLKQCMYLERVCYCGCFV